MAKKSPQKLAEEGATVKPTVVKPIEYTDLKNFIQEQIRTVNESYIKLHKNYYLDTSDRYLQLKKEDEDRRTNLKTPMTLMFTDKVANVIKKLGGRFYVTDLFSEERGEDSEQIMDEMVELVDRVMKEEKNKNTFNDIINDAVLLGPGILKVSYEKEVKKATYTDFNGKTKEVEKYEDGVTFDYVSPYNFFPYYHATELNKAAFIAERLLLTKEQANKLAKKYKTSIQWNKIQTDYDYIEDRDYNALKNSIPYYNYKMGILSENEEADIRIDDVYKLNEKKKLYEVIELHTPTHTWFYINGVEHGPIEGMEQRVLFGYRYRMIGFRKLTGSIRYMGLGHYLRPLQHEFDVITNSRIDNVLLAVNKMIVTSQDTNLGRNNKRIKAGPGKTFKLSDPKNMRFIDAGEIPGSSYRETDNLFGLAQATSGVTGLQLGLQSKVERVAGSSEMLKNAIDDQLIEVVNRLAELRSQLFKDIIVLSLAYMSRKQLDKILGTDNKLKTLDINDVINDYMFSYEPDTEATKKSAVTLQLLINYMNTVVGLADAEGKPVADVVKISDYIREALGLPDEFDLENAPMVQRMGGGAEMPTDEATLRALQGLGAGDMGGMATNQEGVNAQESEQMPPQVGA